MKKIKEILSKYFAMLFIIFIFAAVSFGCFWTTNNSYKTVFECIPTKNLCKINTYDYFGNPEQKQEFKIKEAKTGNDVHNYRKRKGKKSTYKTFYIVTPTQKFDVTREQYEKFQTMSNIDNKPFIHTEKADDGIVLGIIFGSISILLLFMVAKNRT